MVAPALARVCGIAHQVQGRSGARQVTDAEVGPTANQGLVGRGSAAAVTR
jgi:hypothetical protein